MDREKFDYSFMQRVIFKEEGHVYNNQECIIKHYLTKDGINMYAVQMNIYTGFDCMDFCKRGYGYWAREDQLKASTRI